MINPSPFTVALDVGASLELPCDRAHKRATARPPTCREGAAPQRRSKMVHEYIGRASVRAGGP